ncbi:hypothetical protein M8C21_005149 [Ambrosia artemisiifolia]|uniref:GDT1 family protein n=1 Tax=Ambrosia artemisiifolia TaxID=4212 RepID=A0AAD5BKR4_AMBAR|nr:hypothetical protein M8C21_005149 [Ambrosia artemisiifolia]
MKPYGFIFLSLFLILAASHVYAQDVAGDNDGDDSTGSVIDLGRRSKEVFGLLHRNGMVMDLIGSEVGECRQRMCRNRHFFALYREVVVEKLKNNVIGDKIDPKAVLSLDSGLGVFDAFFASLSMILVSEIGDETFIIAALMAMRHPKSIVLSGALSALFVMTILSTGLGRIVPNLISRKHTNSAATGISDSKASQKKEMEEVEEKLESGQGKTAARRFFSRFCTPIFLESFILTFLAEWGDRSQIATIALATHKNALGVAVGATIGHTICTSVAVIGGSMLASKISQGTVATVGGLLFLGFSLSSYFYPPL